MFKTKKSQNVGAIEREVETLTGRLQKLIASKSELETKAETARDARRAVLGGTDDAQVEKATLAVRAISQELIEAEELIKDIEGAIEAAKERLDAARENAARAASAARLRDLATTADKHSPRIEKALAMLAEASRDFIADLPEDLAIFQLHYSARADGGETAPAKPAEVVAAVIAEALDSALPEVFTQTNGSAGYGRALLRFNQIETELELSSYSPFGPANPLSKAMKALVSERLRDRASSIESGEASADLTDIQPQKPKPPTVTHREVRLFVQNQFTYSVDGGIKRTASWRWEHWTPSDVASAAIAAGAAVSMDTPEGIKLFEAEQERRKSVHAGPVTQSEENWVHLGDFARDELQVEAAE